MRRPLLALASLAALVVAVPASASLQPVRRDFGDVHVPLVRAGTIDAGRVGPRARVSVLVRLAEPPLARWNAERSLQGPAGRRKLDVATATSRAYLARLARAQSAAVARLRREIPEATVGRRFRTVLNALAVELPADRLPDLVRQPFARRVYPSLRYTLATNSSPALIGAGAAAAARGVDGAGVKIAIVDDGVHPGNPFFRPAGLRYPPGFPKGARRWTTPKVIVARTFPGPGSGRAGRLAVDPDASYHGTHVAGIAAGVAGTASRGGRDHPATAALSGVAPRAWIGNYRVFTVPTAIGNQALTPEIVAAFEAAVRDGMDVLNFSGGGPAAEPANDALLEAVANLAAAGVVPVISTGNDRDEFGFGTAGSPGTAPEAISVAAVSNSQVFARALTVVSTGERFAFRPGDGTRIPRAWRLGRPLVDVGTLTGRDGRPVDRYLCGPAADPNRRSSTLRAGALRGRLALASRGRCTFVTKAAIARAAGAVGLVLVDNRASEANTIPIELEVPAGTVSDVDGARLRALAARPGGVVVRVSTTTARIGNGRSGVVASFSSSGPTAFGHRLKPDVAAPGGQILSSTLRGFGGPFAVFDGTSMAAPHVAGAAALLVQRHPAWTPRQVKSALMSTATTAWADTARTAEAPVTLGGAGLVSITRADDPKIFTEPASASFGDLDALDGLLVRVTDAGGGAGTWQVGLAPQAATPGATLQVPPAVVVPPGGEATLSLVARAGAGAAAGENYGFVVLRRGGDVRRIPYLFIVSRPALVSAVAPLLRGIVRGDARARSGASRVSRYGYPTAPFGHPPDFGGPSMREDGAERLYAFRVSEPVVNFGAYVVSADEDALVHPWLLGRKDENAVQGYGGTPVNVNPLTDGYQLDIGAVGATFPLPGTYYVAVDAGRDPYTGKLLAARYRVRWWVNDMRPPTIAPLTTRVAAGRPTLAVRVRDVGGRGRRAPGSGVEPLSLVLDHADNLVGADFYDPSTGIAVFPLTGDVPPLRRGRRAVIVRASDRQEAKNLNVAGDDILPNTRARRLRLRVVGGPTVTWLYPERRACLAPEAELVVVAGSTAAIRSVRFEAGGRRVATERRGESGIYVADWRVRGLARGRYVLRAVVTDARGRTAAAERLVRRCRR